MSANTGLITYSGLGQEVMQYYNSLASQDSLYCFLSRVDPWTSEVSPPTPPLDQQYLKNVYKNMFIMKRVHSVDVSPMTNRINWVSGTVYDYYQDNVDILARDMNDNKLLHFYIKNQYDQVFKCLWNNNGAPSTVEPFFEQGYLQANKVYFGIDGYKWAYLYTIEAGIRQKFLDTAWMPTPIANTPGLGYSTVDSGNIPVINVINGGSNYSATDVSVTIVGANTVPAIGTAVISGGTITNILAANTGSGYISANVVISSANGIGALAISPVSPVGGHGSDPFAELGASHVMVTTTFSGDENGKLPVDIDYRQIGFLLNPTSKSSYPDKCAGDIYTLSTDLILSVGTDNFLSDEIVYQGTDLANSYFNGTVLSFDGSNNVLKLINTNGTPQLNRTVIGPSGSRPVSSYSTPDVIPYSGYITYLENREGTIRSADGSEQIRLLIGF